MRGSTEPRSHETGFTLVELMIVLLIIAVLIAIGIPALNRFRDQSVDTEARSDLRTTMEAARYYFLENGAHTGVESQLAISDPDLPTSPDGRTGVAFLHGAAGDLCLYRQTINSTFVAWLSGDTADYRIMYAELVTPPASCPDASGLGGAGFTANPW